MMMEITQCKESPFLLYLSAVYAYLHTHFLFGGIRQGQMGSDSALCSRYCGRGCQASLDPLKKKKALFNLKRDKKRLLFSVMYKITFYTKLTYY